MRDADGLINALAIVAVLMFALVVYDYFAQPQSDGAQDAPGECQTDSDCPAIYCIRAPCPYNVCSGGSCAMVTPPEEEPALAVPPAGDRERDGCRIGGCSSQICAEASEGDIISTCEWTEAYGCYQRLGVCERQPGGKCGWTQTEELASCIQNAS